MSKLQLRTMDPHLVNSKAEVSNLGFCNSSNFSLTTVRVLLMLSSRILRKTHPDRSKHNRFSRNGETEAKVYPVYCSNCTLVQILYFFFSLGK